MDRRDFLRKVGIGSVAVASLPTVVNALAGSARANEEEIGLFFQHNSQLGGTPPFGAGGMGTPPTDIVILSGVGNVKPEDGDVEGGGFFTHFDNTTPVPRVIVGSGTWRARKLLGFLDAGNYGVHKAGRLTMSVELHRLVPSPAVVPGTMEVNCNIGPAGLAPIPMKPEGIELTVGGVTFTAFQGLTVFTIREAEVD